MADVQYWAFISYSSSDSAIAARFHRALETYRIPRSLVGRPGRDAPVPRRLLRVFLDRSEFALSSDLESSIKHALQVSRFLIVICSPPAAKSPWVNKEVQFFKSLGKADHILPIIVEGEPHASEKQALASEAECFPPALLHHIGPDGQLLERCPEPLAGDLRPGRDGWKSALLKAVAGITGLNLDELVRRERKRAFRWRVLQTAALCLLFIAGVAYWDYARLKVSYFAQVTSRWGVPEGVLTLSDDQRAHREVSYRFESRGYKVRAVLRVNSAGSLRDDAENHNAARIEVVYQEDGSPLRLDLFDHNNQLVMREAYSSLEPRDADGRVAQTVKFETQSEFSQNLDAGFVTLTASAHRNASLPPTKSAIAAQRLTYDTSGRLLQRTYFNASGTPVRSAGGAFGQRLAYDQRGRVTRTTNLGGDGMALPDRHGVVAVVRELDSMGNTVSIRCLGVKDHPACGTDFIATTRSIFNGYACEIETAYFAPDGTPALHHDGYAKITRTFDDHGNIISEETFGADGKPTPRLNGYAKLIRKLDARGNILEESYFDVNGQPALWRGTFAKLTAVFDQRGNVIEQAYLGLDGKPSLGPDNYARITWAYDARGHVIEEAYFGLDGKPTLNSWHTASLKSNYDDRGRLIAQAYFGLDGQPTLCPKGYAKMTMTFDDRGNETEEAYFGLNGKLTRHLEGNAKFTKTYDDRGNAVAYTYFGPDDKPVIGPDGYAKFTGTYDERGNLKAWAFLDADDKPVLHREGYAMGTQKHDDQGNRIEEAYFNVDGKPSLCRAGFARFTEVFDQRGNVIEEAYFDVDNKPTLQRDGYAKCRRTFDDRGNIIAEAYFGIDARPTLHRLGYAKATWAYDNRNHVVEEAFFDAEGQRTSPKPPQTMP